MKRCPECGIWKPFEDFVRNRATKDGLGSYCKPCHNEVSRRNKRRRYGSEKAYSIAYRYGVSVKTVQELLDAQGGLCAICSEPGPTHIDHDHVDGAIRGILCFGCNGALGQFEDDISRMRQAITYLRFFAELADRPAQLRLDLSA